MEIKQENITSMMPVKKKRDRFNGMTEEEVLQRTLPDHLVSGLDIIIVGSFMLAPTVFSLDTGRNMSGQSSGLEINGGPVARVYQKSRRATNPSEAVVRWATKTWPADITSVSFFTVFAVAVTATMLFVFNISTIVIYSFFVASRNSISNFSSNVYAE